MTHQASRTAEGRRAGRESETHYMEQALRVFFRVASRVSAQNSVRLAEASLLSGAKLC